MRLIYDMGGVFHVLLRKTYIQLLDGVCMLGSSGCCIVVFVFSISLLTFCMVVLSIIESGVSNYCRNIYFAFYSLSVSVFWSFDVWCLHIYNCIIFWVHWPFYRYKGGSCLQFVNNAASVKHREAKHNKVRCACALSDTSVVPLSLRVTVCVNVFPRFHFQPNCNRSKVSCRKHTIGSRLVIF